MSGGNRDALRSKMAAIDFVKAMLIIFILDGLDSSGYSWLSWPFNEGHGNFVLSEAPPIQAGPNEEGESPGGVSRTASLRERGIIFSEASPIQARPI